MPSFTLVPTLNKATMTPEWKSIPQFKSKGRQFLHQGVVYEVFNKKEKFHPIFVRIAVIAATIILLGMTLLSKTIRNIFFKDRETAHLAVPIKTLQPPVNPYEYEMEFLTQKADKHVTLVPLYREIDRIRETDRTSPPNNWKKGAGSHEKEETLEAFNMDFCANRNAKRHTVNIIFLGDLTDQEKRITTIVAHYLHAVHDLQIRIAQTALDLNPQSQREKFGHVQYSTNSQYDILVPYAGENCYALGFTNQDIHPSDRPRMNFLFGQANPVIACGLFSTKRLSGNGVEKTIVRLMKLASHELAHDRGLAHCTENVCAVQGINNVEELDQSSLIFCSQDMAKISLINNSSLRQGYQKQLTFFENFFHRYNLNIDFSKEIDELRKKIHKLSAE